MARAELVEFRDYDVQTGTFTNAARECTLVTGETRILESGWWAVDDEVAIPTVTNLTVIGTAHHINFDGGTEIAKAVISFLGGGPFPRGLVLGSVWKRGKTF